MPIPQFSFEYGPSRSTTYRLLKDKELVAVKLGRRTLIRREDADAWARRLAVYKPTK